MQPKVSVIMPVYNTEPYIRGSIESVLNQTFTNFELIIVNDGSTDRCPQICDEFARLDNRIKVIHKKH
jgi:glycosyltransferase involved in cell wall biosynthesis